MRIWPLKAWLLAYCVQNTFCHSKCIIQESWYNHLDLSAERFETKKLKKYWSINVLDPSKSYSTAKKKCVALIEAHFMCSNSANKHASHCWRKTAWICHKDWQQLLTKFEQNKTWNWFKQDFVHTYLKFSPLA